MKVYYDVGNSTDKGRDVAKEIRALGKLICEFHAKDGQYMLGQGRIDFKQVRQAMDDIEYSGWIQIEAAIPTASFPITRPTASISRASSLPACELPAHPDYSRAVQVAPASCLCCPDTGWKPVLRGGRRLETCVTRTAWGERRTRTCGKGR